MEELCYWIGFNRVPHIGPVRVKRLLDHYGDLASAWRADATTLRALGLPRNAVESLLYERGRIDLAAELDRVRESGVQVYTWNSPDYPPLLRSIDQPPPVIYVRGDITPADEFAVAMVGTRNATTYGKDMARKLATGLAESQITVVSGLALGIDGVAHRAALDAGGRTLAVLACGLDTVYPQRHRELAKQICENGALISDYALGTKPDASNFPPRNRIISGLSLGTVVIEAGKRSGALITLHFALDQGRETFAVPGSVYSRASDGTNGAIQKGEAKLVTSLKDILEELNLTMVSQQVQVREVVPDNPIEEKLLGCLSAEPAQLDDIVRASGLPTATVSSTLCMMELKGQVRRVENMCYVLAR